MTSGNNIQSRVSLKGLETVEDVFPMVMTLNKQYGKWTDKDWKSIAVELIEASNDGYNQFLAVFEKYYSDYVIFYDKKT